MAELFRSDAEAEARAGTTVGPGMQLPADGTEPWLVDRTRLDLRIADALAVPTQLEVYKDGDLTYGVRPGRFMNGDTAVTYAGATGQALTNNATNYIYLNAAGILLKSTTGFPNPSNTTHVPLATIVTSGGTYSIDAGHITDYRGRSMFRVLAGPTAANLNTLSGGAVSDADALHTHAGKVSSTRTITAGNGLSGGGNLTADRTLAVAADATGGANLAKAISVTANGVAVKVDGSTVQGNGSDQLELKDGAVTAAKLATAMKQAVRSVGITIGAKVGDNIPITIQLKDAEGTPLAQRALVQLWPAATDFGAPALDEAYVTTGTTICSTAEGMYAVLTDANGAIVIEIVDPSADRYLMAEVDGRVYSSGVISWA
jgi:hypothetical protein